MRRLIIKELHEQRLFLAAGLVLSILVTLGGDPTLFWRGDTAGGWLMVLCIPFLFMGLGMYSREYAKDTLSFALSRPVRWWWVYVAKLLAGLIGCVAVAAISAGVYVVAGPRAYIPFLSATDLLQGMGTLAAWCAYGYLGGFVVSCVAPGLALSFLVGYGLMSVMGLAALFCFMTSEAAHPFFVLYAALLLASIMAVRVPVVLAHKRRIWLWVKIMGGGLAAFFLVAVVVAFVGVPQSQSHVSPDFRTTAYLYCLPDDPGRRSDFPGFYREDTRSRRPDELWVRVGEGPRVPVDRQRTIHRHLAWSPDSKSLVYYVYDGDRWRAKVTSARSGWRALTICELPASADSEGPWGAVSLEWSPSAGKLAAAPGRPHRELHVLALHSGKHEVVFRGKFLSFRWIDDGAIEVEDYRHKASVVEIDKAADSR